MAEVPSLIPEVLDRPGTHALVIGVSRYRHVQGTAEETRRGRDYPIDQLGSAARTAHRFATWLLQRRYETPLPPLASLRVLLSPQPGEIDVAAQDPRLAAAPAANAANVARALRAFRDACESDRDNHAVVYVVGHGAQITKHGALLLLEDFASDDFNNLLDGALDVVDVHQALQTPRAARQQCWFVDVCRQRAAVVDALERLRGGIGLDKDPGNITASPLFMAAMGDTQAYALRGRHSLFCEALLWALDSAGAARGPDGGVAHWHVPLGGLYEALPRRVQTLAAEIGIEQFVEINGVANPGVFHIYDSGPPVALTVRIAPGAVEPHSQLDLMDAQMAPVLSTMQWPVSTKVPAGIYGFFVTPPTPFRKYTKFVALQPPAVDYLAELLP
jgi:hypothetical protein